MIHHRTSLAFSIFTHNHDDDEIIDDDDEIPPYLRTTSRCLRLRGRFRLSKLPNDDNPCQNFIIRTTEDDIGRK